MRDTRAKFRATFRLLEAAKRIAEKLDKANATYEYSNRVDEIRIVEGYAEPGYDGDVIALGNWNTLTVYDRRLQTRETMPGGDLLERLSEAFERIGVSIEWGDEWSECSGCNKCFRTSPDSYSWKPSYTMYDCELLCEECTLEDTSEYLESIEGDESKACTLDVNLESEGYVRVGDTFENGLHPGQADSPKLIAKALRAMGITRFLFSIDDQGQFDTRFSAWVHESESERFTSFEPQAIEESPSPAERAERFLREASRVLREQESKDGKS